MTTLRSRGAHGATLAELLVVLAAGGVLLAMTVPASMAGRSEYLARRTARHLAATLHQARSQAIAGGRHMAVRFAVGPSDGWQVLADGNRNGVRTADIDRGIDWPVAPPQLLAAIGAEVRFGLVHGVTDVESGAALDGTPIKVAGLVVSFSPTGSASSGTIYLAGPGRRQLAVRVLGATGRIRVLRFDDAQRTWTPL